MGCWASEENIKAKDLRGGIIPKNDTFQGVVIPVIS